MMQQQVYQQDAGVQGVQEQVGQQMVLCPVRFVYETQMLMQPGEQIQQPQTILINPQNPPPWIQNRPVQNRVIYVQQMPGTYMPSQPQHIDQNQLYIQNYGYQNVPQMLVQNQDQRTMQMIAPNIMANVQPNITPNIQANIGPNVQNPNVQRIISNVPMQNQINIGQPVNQTVPVNRQIISNQMVNMNEVNNVETQEIPAPNIYRQTPQIIQDPRFASQTIAMVPTNMQNTPRLQFEANPNVCQIRPTQPNVTANMPPPYPRPVSVTNQDNRKVVTAVNKGTNFNAMSSNRSPVQMLRPIQPRPNQIRPNANFLPIQPANAQNTVNSNRKIMPNLIPATNINETSNSKSVSYNRKRKSESPDEIQKKVSMNSSNDNIVVIKQIENVAKMADVGVNTSPIHKADGRIIINNMQITPINSTQNNKIKEEIVKFVRNTLTLEPQNVVRNVSVQATPKSFSSLVEKEKLIRNTVYTQARGRLLNDKTADVSKTENVNEITKMEVSNTNVNENKTTEVKSLPILTQDVKQSSTTAETKTDELKPPKIENVFNEAKTIKVENICNTEIKTVESKPLPNQMKDKHNPLENKTAESKSLPNQMKDKHNPLENKTAESKSLPNQMKDKHNPLENKTAESKSLPNQTKDKHSPLENKTAESKSLPRIIKEIKQEKTAPVKPNVEPMEVLPVIKKEDVKIKNNKKKQELKREQSEKGEVKEKPEVKHKEDRDFILTHVLGGFVIQESNVAFPIRKPLKEKTLEINEVKKEDKEKDTKDIKNTSKILDISNLNIEECENMKGDSDDSKDKENPFSSLKLGTVKNWTAEELSTHLSKYAWNDTVSVLQEHEIDGESLLLVSKLQLISIGVSENHADIIAEFIKK